MRQLTAKTVNEVHNWIETTAHHRASLEPADAAPGKSTHMVLSGRTKRLRIPIEIWRSCSVESGGEFDTRMYRRKVDD